MVYNSFYQHFNNLKVLIFKDNCFFRGDYFIYPYNVWPSLHKYISFYVHRPFFLTMGFIHFLRMFDYKNFFRFVFWTQTYLWSVYPIYLPIILLLFSQVIVISSPFNFNFGGSLCWCYGWSYWCQFFWLYCTLQPFLYLVGSESMKGSPLHSTRLVRPFTQTVKGHRFACKWIVDSVTKEGSTNEFSLLHIHVCFWTYVYKYLQNKYYWVALLLGFQMLFSCLTRYKYVPLWWVVWWLSELYISRVFVIQLVFFGLVLLYMTYQGRYILRFCRFSCTLLSLVLSLKGPPIFWPTLDSVSLKHTLFW